MAQTAMHDTTPRKTSLTWWALGLFCVSLVVRLWGLNVQGNVWDEYFYYDAARDYARNALQGNVDPTAWRSNREHPPLGKYVYIPSLIWNHSQDVSDRDAYHAPRVISALLGALTVVLVLLIGFHAFSLRVGIVSATIYSLLPPVLAYGKIIALDPLLILLLTGAMYATLRWLQTESLRALWTAAFLFSLAFATKFNAILLLPVPYLLLLYRQRGTLRSTGAVTLPLPLLVFPAVVGLVLIAVWPWLWGDTIAHIMETLGHWGGKIYELFLGHTGEAPVWYFVVHAVVGTPLGVLFLAALGIAAAFQRRTETDLLLLLWLVLPFGMSLYHLRQDHLRYVLDAFPALALLAGLGFWWLVDRLPRPRLAVPAALAILGAYLALVVWQIHPYYLEYYNLLVGGPRGVAERNLFDLGFYGEGVKEATAYVNRIAPDGATVRYEVIPDDAPYLDRPRLQRLDTNEADFLIINSNAKRHPTKLAEVELGAYTEVYAVYAGGAPFVWVYQRNR